ncbi:DNA polymerase III subunit beta [Ammoniphilus sp. CFH 90114]|uniref:DNA polymerase III subunit beta n=1 Tax=Ammoniphilus sp. CFH 90114 TaxID=2493665 RepID=UPI00100E7179|nr:DNA polymerase III subunit beta [Ammoniphilus sp. CFH 90114]RXT08900.1 DNA polymerase III subunit beta [Ammoniphilus sp. CFH 90114]
MHLMINRDIMTAAINDVSKAVSTRTTIPILTGIKISSHSEGITLTASDSDISIEYTIPLEQEGDLYVDIKQHGSIVLPARYLNDIVRRLPGEFVELEVGDRFQTILRSGKSEFNLNGLDPDDFPRLPQIEEEKVFSLPCDILKTMVKQTVFAAATTELRPILTGIMWALEGDQLRFVATDSHRLASKKSFVEASSELTIDNIVTPGKSMQELSKILSDNDSLVDIVVTDNQILFKTQRILFYSRLLNGTYPDVNRIIPQQSKTDIILKTKEFLHAIERASLLAKDGKNNVVKFSVTPDSHVELSSISPEVGKVTEELQATSIEGEELKISFNAKYMLDTLRVIDSEEVKIRFTGAMSPFIIHPTENELSLYLILPVRTY